MELITLVLALYFGPTSEQLDYCLNAGWSYEIECIDGHCFLSDEAEEKARVCNMLIDIYTSSLFYQFELPKKIR